MGMSLRVSVIDNCQLRCGYCLPYGAKNVLPKANLLTVEQYQKLGQALRPLVLDKIRFTGGEPLLRRDIAPIIESFKHLLCPLTLTTNGLGFLPLKKQLKRAGLSSLTFHLDTLREEKYARLMGKGQVVSILKAIEEAMAEGFSTKINMVVQRGRNDDELYDFLLLSKKMAVPVRFIELMNTGSAKDFVQEVFMSGQEILNILGKFDEISSSGRAKPSDPAELFRAEALGLNFGLIASDTRPFCADCNRLRLSADGQLRTCLYQPLGHKIDFSLSEKQITQSILAIKALKTSFHPSQNRQLRDFSMSQVGG